MISRRELIIAFGVCVFAAPLRSFAQQGKVWRVGCLIQRRVRPLDSDALGAFPQGMRELGYIEGKNLVIEWRSADGKVQNLPRLASELVRLKVDVIMAVGTAAVGAAQKATSTIPIVMGTAGDPVLSGFVASLARPGGNITGLSNLMVDLSPKHLELLNSVVPKLSHVAVLLNPTNDVHGTILKSIQSAAQQTGVKILPMEARTSQDIESAFSVMEHEKIGAVIVVLDALFTQQRLQMAHLAEKYHLPLMGPTFMDVEAGLLMSYGSDPANLFRRAAIYVDKILKGAKPRDLPVEQPMKIELVINLKTAKRLGLTIPPNVLARADRVIE